MFESKGWVSAFHQQTHQSKWVVNGLVCKLVICDLHNLNLAVEIESIINEPYTCCSYATYKNDHYLRKD